MSHSGRLHLACHSVFLTPQTQSGTGLGAVRPAAEHQSPPREDLGPLPPHTGLTWASGTDWADWVQVQLPPFPGDLGQVR